MMTSDSGMVGDRPAHPRWRVPLRVLGGLGWWLAEAGGTPSPLALAAAVD